MDIRIDKILIPKMKKTKEGFLKGKAIVTRTGVFKYLNHDGSIRYELRHPDDILTEKSLNTLKSIPITNEHPSDLVTVENAHSFVVGMTGEEILVNDDDSIITTLTITHKDAIDVIMRGKQGLSAAYKLDVIKEEGIYKGEKYTHRQINVEYNHISTVEEGRAGKKARINLDNINTNVLIQYTGNNMDNNEEILETEVNEKVNTKTEVNKDTINLDKYVAKIDQLKAENNELKTKLNEINIDSIVADKVRAKTLLMAKVSKVIAMDANDLIEKSERQIMEDVIKHFDTEINLDEKSNSYVEGRFDAIIETKQEDKEFTMPNLARNDSSKNKMGFDQDKLIEKMNKFLGK